MNLGTTIALIYFVIIVYYVVAYICYYISAFYPSFVWRDTCPEVYLAVLRMINMVLDWIFSRLFLILTTVLIILYLIWLVLKSLPWPFNGLKKTPPLGDLEKAGIFPLFEKLSKILFSLGYPRKKLRQAVDSVGIFLKDFLLEWSKDKNKRMYEIIERRAPKTEKYPVKVDRSERNDNSERPKDPNESKERMISMLEKIIKEREKACIIQNTKNITSDMDVFTIQRIKAENSNAEINCQVASMPEYLKLNISNV